MHLQIDCTQIHPCIHSFSITSSPACHRAAGAKKNGIEGRAKVHKNSLRDGNIKQDLWTNACKPDQCMEFSSNTENNNLKPTVWRIIGEHKIEKGFLFFIAGKKKKKKINRA